MSGADTNAMDHLRAEIRKLMNDISDAITQGGCKDYASYSHQCGVIQGLALAERELLAVQRAIEEA